MKSTRVEQFKQLIVIKNELQLSVIIKKLNFSLLYILVNFITFIKSNSIHKK